MPLPPVNLDELPAEFKQAVEAIRKVVPERLSKPTWGIICGSGLSGLASTLEDKVEVPYTEIPGFSQSTVQGHQSSLAFGFLSQPSESDPNEIIKVAVVACLGRFHTYEGHSAQSCVFPTRVMRCLGAEAVIVTNAAGGLNDNFEVGTIVALHDHLSLPSLTSMNPLIGHNLSALGPRFPPLSNAYDVDLRIRLFKAAQKIGLPSSAMQQGTYAYVLGPTYESRAEARFLKNVGADCVGMSTVPEVIAATHSGMKVLAISLITNKVVLSPYFDTRAFLEKEGEHTSSSNQAQKKDDKEAANHEEVLEVGRMRAEDMRKLVQTVVCQTRL
ncbi:inosine guanosine and [Violaceomyces palustris]|uniref:Inosine guanosine and n=1 Tax=Violaceomyces palustris TaxID=1673888 RepID=A0ACD0NY65_9BASI|nr:inosine guanosine and [Violaceomyces palustris]